MSAEEDKVQATEPEKPAPRPGEATASRGTGKVKVWGIIVAAVLIGLAIAAGVLGWGN